MGKRSVRENKNIYQLSREAMELTRDQASERLEYISPERIEKIESEKVVPHPDEVMRMGEIYKNAELCNYYCTHECPIGQKYVPELKVKDLSQVTLEMLASLNAMEADKNRLIEITVDGKITDDEKKDFITINEKLQDISVAVQSLQLWVNQAIIDGSIK